MAYYTVQGFIGAPQSLRRAMLVSVHGQTVIRWMREASEQWNTNAFAALSDTVANYPGSGTEYCAIPLQVQALLARLEPTEAGFLLAAIHARFSSSRHAGHWDLEFKDGFQLPLPKRCTVNSHESPVSSSEDEINSGESSAKSGGILTTEDSMQLAREVQRAMSTKCVLEILTARGVGGPGRQTVDRVADLHVVFQTYLETMNRYGIEPRYTEFENALEAFGAPIPERSKGLNSLDYLMTI